MVYIRNATMEDAERLLEIYGYYVDNTAITFEFPAPTLDGKNNVALSFFGHFK